MPIRKRACYQLNCDTVAIIALIVIFRDISKKNWTGNPYWLIEHIFESSQVTIITCPMVWENRLTEHQRMKAPWPKPHSQWQGGMQTRDVWHQSMCLLHCPIGLGAVWGKLSRLTCVAEGTGSGNLPWPVHSTAECSTEGCPLCLASLVLRMDNLIGRINQGT